ncbi:PaaX family transcriptional regulator [Streptomyces resistomycificus]|uniref:PaaX family transcriptional regulator n=1 Tax=Streptomyces resistomycificus TaxID=67356 RepID=A0A0L8L0A9_9ACTN|nr:PaaX family transcriptional regulator C-terminal domain-containing protein [Streptomyces resistomycificus]KOG31560.1 PaaX family transcriptional regulator [Streptomyces resistomycificus]KUO00641.1 PaaX family transcriptional regulator [Streptomyces resistomycificus]
MANLSHLEEIFSGDGDGAEPMRPRRWQAGGSPAGLAVTLIADYTFPVRAWLPAAAIVALLGEFGVADGTARTTISRLARRGVLEGARQGRYSSYRLTREAAVDLWSGGGSIATFTTQPDSWDGWWTLVAFSVPEQESTRRRALRTALRWRGFAPLYDAVWASPHPLTPKGLVELADLALGAVSVFRARQVDLETEANRNPVEAWDLAGIAEQYEIFIRRWSGSLPGISAGAVTGADAVHARTEVMSTYRHFPVLDPLLPVDLLPADWPRSRAREICVAVYDGLAHPAQEHVRSVVARFVDGPHPDVRAHTIAGMSAGIGHSPG